MSTHFRSLLRYAIYTLGLLAFGLTLYGCQNPQPKQVPAPVPESESVPPPQPDHSEELEAVDPPPWSPPVTGNNSDRPADQYALVVGINEYQHADGRYLRNLAGAVNDAEVLRDALRKAEVQLPDERVLLDAGATRAAFINAWQNMIDQAQPGDTLILTFAGHGGQQTDTEPLDEKDNYDETFMFHDFKSPNQGLIKDEELYALLKKASDYRIVVIADSCHSSGMVRSVARRAGLSRAGGQWDIPTDSPPPPPFPTLPAESEEGDTLEHVTLITAVHSDSLVVNETTFEGQSHGALSWYFAKALDGQADGNQNGRLERGELDRFLLEKIGDQMNNSQQPKMRPRADNQAVITLPSGTTLEPPPARPNLPPIRIVVENTRAPSGLKHIISLGNSEPAFDLRFDGNDQDTKVFNNTGDQTTLLSNNTLNTWQRVINKERLLKALETQFDMSLKPIKISLKEGDDVHKKGDKRTFSIAAGDTAEGLNALTLFNLAGNGEQQFLYPLPKYKDSLIIQKFPYRLPPMKVVPPYGEDNLVAILCAKPVTGLHTLLMETQPEIPKPEQIIAYLHSNRCQVGQYAFFSQE